MRSVLFAPAAKFGQLNAGLKFLVFGGIIADAFAFGAFHFDEIFLAHIGVAIIPYSLNFGNSRLSDSNRGPTLYKSVALPAELRRRTSF
jgi:hypothetical protein